MFSVGGQEECGDIVPQLQLNGQNWELILLAQLPLSTPWILSPVRLRVPPGMTVLRCCCSQDASRHCKISSQIQNIYVGQIFLCEAFYQKLYFPYEYFQI